MLVEMIASVLLPSEDDPGKEIETSGLEQSPAIKFLPSSDSRNGRRDRVVFLKRRSFKAGLPKMRDR